MWTRAKEKKFREMVDYRRSNWPWFDAKIREFEKLKKKWPKVKLPSVLQKDKI